MSVEGFTCLLVFKNIFSFALTFWGFEWIAGKGRIQPVFTAIASVQVGVCMLTVPMCKSRDMLGVCGFLTSMADVLGKKNRSFFWRHNVFFKVTDWIADRLTFW